MPFHREYPVRTYNGLMKDLAVPEERPRRREPKRDEERERLEALSTVQLRALAKREGLSVGGLGRGARQRYIEAILKASRRKPEEPRRDIWGDVYRSLLNYPIEQLEDMARREGVDPIPDGATKNDLTRMIIEKRKERLSGKGRG